MIRWKISGSTIVGNTHQKYGIKGQDRYCVKIVDGTAVVVVTDGVGSATHALEGANAVCIGMADLLSRRGEDLLAYKADEFMSFVKASVEEILKTKSRELGCSVRDLDTTLMVFVSNGLRFIAGGMGDGLIGRMNPESLDSEVIIGPEKGRFANESYFVASSDFDRHFHIVAGSYDVRSVYFLMTDGSCECLYNPHTKDYAKALPVFCGWARTYPREAVNEALFGSMNKLFRERTADDCALVLITESSGG